MATVVERMNCMRYDRGPSGPVSLPSELVDRPSWEQVQAAIRRMENFCYPIVTLAFDESEKDGLVIVGGPRRHAMIRVDGSWQYERPDGGNQEVQLWTSDQGYYCRERNIHQFKTEGVGDRPGVLRDGRFRQGRRGREPPGAAKATAVWPGAIRGAALRFS